MLKKVAVISALAGILVSQSHAADWFSKKKKEQEPAAKVITQPAVVDDRKGITLERIIKENPYDLSYSQQKGGAKPLYANLFSPTLAQWVKEKDKIKYHSSDLIHEKDITPPKLPQQINEVADLSHVQYFYKESLHAELAGPKAKEILDFTHSRGGKVYISTTIAKVYPKKSYVDEDTNETEYSQCIDVLTRITVTKVPMRNDSGLERLVDYWHDIKNYQCRSNAPTD